MKWRPLDAKRIEVRGTRAGELRNYPIRIVYVLAPDGKALTVESSDVVDNFGSRASDLIR